MAVARFVTKRAVGFAIDHLDVVLLVLGNFGVFFSPGPEVVGVGLFHFGDGVFLDAELLFVGASDDAYRLEALGEVGDALLGDAVLIWQLGIEPLHSFLVALRVLLPSALAAGSPRSASVTP